MAVDEGRFRTKPPAPRLCRSGCRSTRIRYDMFSPDQEPSSHRTLAFHLDDAAFFEVKPLRELVTGLGRDLNFPRFAGRFHARGDVHGVTPRPRRRGQ